MAGAMGYTAPSYNNIGYNGNYNFNPNMYNNQMSPYAQQLRNLEMQNPQFGQTMPPPINNQQFQQNVQQHSQQLQNNNQTNLFTPVAIVATAQEASTQIPDMVSGTKSIFYDAASDQFYMNYFDFDTGKKVFRVYPNSEKPIETNNATEQSESPVESITESNVKYVTDEDMQPLQCQISGLEAELDKLKKYISDLEKELFIDESNGNDSNDGAKRTSNGKAASSPNKSKSGNVKRPNNQSGTADVPTVEG